MSIGSLFSGIGGLELGLERAGLGPTVWQVETDPWCRKVLAKHWPDADRSVTDVRSANAANLSPVDVVCGGFPCQDISRPGGAGLDGHRSGLWFEFERVVRELRPGWVVVENTASNASRWIDEVRGALERSGYATLPIPIAAADCGAPHRRARIFVVAYLDRAGVRERAERRASRPSREVRGGKVSEPGHALRWPNELGIRRNGDGLPVGVVEHRALGNAVVPQCAEVIGHVIRGLHLD